MEVLDRVGNTLALLEQPTAERFDRSASAGSSPRNSISLLRLAEPPTSVSRPGSMSSASASSRITASLALPCSGATATRTFQPSP
jgi:hypothetical protein